MRLVFLGILALAGAGAGLALAADPPITFTDATAAAGIRFKHTSGAYGKKFLPRPWARCGSRLRRRRLAGHPVRELEELARPPGPPTQPPSPQ